MTQKMIMGALVVLIIGVIGAGIQSAFPANTMAATDDVADNSLQVDPVEPTIARATPGTSTMSGQRQPTAEFTREPRVMAADTLGANWSGAGTITVLDDFGFTLETADTGTIYIELGPPDFWQLQGIPLAEGETVQIEGWNNEEQIHARVITTTKGDIVLRSESGQPLWAGGASDTQGQHGAQNGTGTTQSGFQVAPEDWVTVSGSIISVTNGAVSVATAEGTIYNLQMGQRNFWQSQGVTLNNGDEVEVLGFWMDQRFMVGDITKVATGEHIILRDPNGRQLWGGPGRNGNSNGNGNGNGNGRGNRWGSGQ